MTAHRAVILARTHSAARALGAQPNSPFTPVPATGDAGVLGGFVVGVRGLHGGSVSGLLDSGLANTLLVAWHLHPSDHATKLAALTIDSGDPETVLRQTRGLFLPYRAGTPNPKMPPGVSFDNPGFVHTDMLLSDTDKALRDRGKGGVTIEPGKHITVPPGASLEIGVRPFGRRSMFALVRDTALQLGIAPALALAIADAESGFNPLIVSRAGAIGVMQLMPATAKAMGVSDPFDPQQNVAGGLAYLKLQYDRHQNIWDTLAAYHSGPGSVRDRGYTQADHVYFKSVLTRWHMYQKMLLDEGIISISP